MRILRGDAESEAVTARAISRDAYREHIASGKCLTQWMRVYAAIEAQPAVTRAEIERLLDMRISSVTGRVRELLDAGQIAECGLKTCSVTGETVHGLVVADRQFRGGDSAGYTPEQIALWEREQEADRWANLAYWVLQQPREDQGRFYRRWKARHGEASAAKLVEAIKAEQRRQRRAA